MRRRSQSALRENHRDGAELVPRFEVLVRLPRIALRIAVPNRMLRRMI